MAGRQRKLTVVERNAIVVHFMPKARRTAKTCWIKTRCLFDRDELEQVGLVGLLQDIESWRESKGPVDHFVLMVVRRRIFNWMRLDQHGIVDRKALRVKTRMSSLNEPIHEDSPVTHADQLVSPAPSPLEVVDGIRTREQLNAAIASLTPMQQAVIVGLYVHENENARKDTTSGYFHHNMGVKALRFALTGETETPGNPGILQRCAVPTARSAEIVASIRKGVPLTASQRVELQRVACWKPCSSARRQEIAAARRELAAKTAEGNRVVTAAQASELRVRVAAGERCSDVARALGVKYTTAHAIVKGRSWANLPEAA